MKTKENTTKNAVMESADSDGFAIPKRNIRYIIAGLVIMILGYIVMMGGGSKDPNVFNESMFNTLRTVIAPVLILAGMVVEIWAIMYRGKGYKE